MPIKNPHDKFFRSVFSEKKVALGYLLEFLPSEITDELDLDTLEQENNSYIDKNLDEHFSDIVYRCNFKRQENTTQNQNEIWLSFLFEHKSYPVYFVFLQLLQYVVNIWSQLLKQNKPLKIIIPIVVYHGKKEWEMRKIEDFFYVPNKHFRKFLPIFDYILTDLSVTSDDRIKQIRQNAKLFNALMALKHSRDLKFILENLALILANAEEYLENKEGQNFFHTIIVYLTTTTSPNKKDFLKSVNQLKPKLKKNVMTLYEQLIQEGRQQGKAEGKVETLHQATTRLIQKGADDAFIMEILDVTADFIQLIRSEIKSS